MERGKHHRGGELSLIDLNLRLGYNHAHECRPVRSDVDKVKSEKASSLVLLHAKL